MTKREILGSIIGMMVAGATILLVLTLTLTPSSPSYGLAVALILPTVIIAEIIAVAWTRARRKRGSTPTT